MGPKTWGRLAFGRYFAGMTLVVSLCGCLSSSFATVHYSAYMCTLTQYSVRISTGVDNSFSVSGWKATDDARILSCPVNVPPRRDRATLAGRTIEISARVDDRNPGSAMVMELFALNAGGKVTSLQRRVEDAEGPTGIGKYTLHIKATLQEGVTYVYFDLLLPTRSSKGSSALLGYRVAIN